MAGILLIQTAFIGDVVLATPLIERLKTELPHEPIDFLLRKGNESLLHDHPHIRKLWIWDKQQQKYQNLLRLSRALRKESYTFIVNLQRFASTGIFTLLSGAHHSIGFKKNPLSFFFTNKIGHQIQEGVHEIDRNLALLEPILGKASKRYLPKLYPSETDWKQVEPFQQAPFVCIAPTSVWFTKQFPAHKWIDLIEYLPHTHTVYLLGGPGDQHACEQIRNACQNPRVENLAGKLSLLQSAALMKKSSMNYVNDSAPMHLSSSVNAPTTAVFCSTQPGFGFGPLSEVARVIENIDPPTCKPCGLHGYAQCPQKHFRCAEEISIDQFPIPS